MSFLSDAHRKEPISNRYRRLHATATLLSLIRASSSYGTVRLEPELRQIQDNPHTTDRFRRIEVLKDLAEFGDAHAPKSEKLMTPADFCRVWQQLIFTRSDRSHNYLLPALRDVAGEPKVEKPRCRFAVGAR
jgi:hypothetical protein